MQILLVTVILLPLRPRGKLHAYKREISGFWQCSAYLAGKNRRLTTKEESLSHAKEIAEDWYLELRGKARASTTVTATSEPRTAYATPTSAFA